MIIHTKVKFDAAHRLYEYPGKCQNLHGHGFLAEVWLEGMKQDRFGMLVDFFDVKEKIGILDHTTILNKADPMFNLLMLNTHVVGLDANPTAENIAIYILNMLRSDMNVIRVRVYENENSYAEIER